MPKAQAKRPIISIVGPGRLGSALAINLKRAGWDIAYLVIRRRGSNARRASELADKLGATVVWLGDSPLPQGLVWITVPDDAITGVADRLAGMQEWTGQSVFHSSGALTSDALRPLREKGARVASVHPGMTFVDTTAATLKGVPFGVEGDAAALRLARQIIRDLGGTVVTIRKQNKVLYHAFDAFASPMMVALMAALEEVGKAAGIRQRELRTMSGPLLRQTLGNYLEYGAAGAFSGPFVRGDVAVIQNHLNALGSVPAAREVYLALARVAVKKLPVKNRAAVERILRGAGGSQAERKA